MSLDHAAAARALLEKFQDQIVERHWKTEEARNRYRAARTTLWPAVYWNREALEREFASLLAETAAAARRHALEGAAIAFEGPERGDLLERENVAGLLRAMAGVPKDAGPGF